MNKICFILFAVVILTACGNKKTQQSRPILVIEEIREFVIDSKSDTIDLGNIKEGSIAEFKVRLINNDMIPLVIIEVVPDCGCTATEFDKTPIMPQTYGEISMSYDTRNQSGIQTKNVSILSSLENSPKKLFITVKVDPEE
ncbi:MAG: DUF1573 domain-containing protein [Rikenellaceae bacterium]|nr:DUF1573 domain-containing protein [Rikenellaceae bacterium]